MKRIKLPVPSSALVIAVVALVFAVGGTAVAAKKLSLGALSNGAKNKTVGVGKLTYVTTTKALPGGSGPGVSFDVPVSATCPSGLKVIGGGIKAPDPDPGSGNIEIHDSHPTTTGWAGRIGNFSTAGHDTTATTTAICASARVVTGAPPSS
jgi:hypothetical protein